jgi:hypothetical protein
MKPVIILCSTAHLTKEDVCTLIFLSAGEKNMPWVYHTQYGFILDLGSFSFPLLHMKSCGVSESLRRFVYHMQRKYQARYIHFDCDADVIDDEAVFE